MLISNVTNTYSIQNAETPVSTNQDINRDVAELRRQLFSEDFNNANCITLQNLLFKAHQALKQGNDAFARQYVDEAFQTINKTKEETQNHSEKTLKNTPTPSLSKSNVNEATYQEASNDPSVSFKYPQKLNESQAAIAVPAHEGEHVQRAVFEAQNKGVLAHVRIQYNYGINNQGKMYLKGGKTTASIPVKKEYQTLSQRTNSVIDIKA